MSSMRDTARIIAIGLFSVGMAACSSSNTDDLRSYVEDYPELYGPVLRARPGITGLATIVYHRTEERLLAACTSAEETDAVYRTRCVPSKAKLDLIYAANQSVCFDALLMLATVPGNPPSKALGPNSLRRCPTIMMPSDAAMVPTAPRRMAAATATAAMTATSMITSRPAASTDQCQSPKRPAKKGPARAQIINVQ